MEKKLSKLLQIIKNKKCNFIVLYCYSFEANLDREKSKKKKGNKRKNLYRINSLLIFEYKTKKSQIL